MQARLIQRAGRIKRIPQGHQRGRAAAASRQLALLGISVRIILERRIQDGSVMEVT
jgi:hypothetical protein